MGLEEGTAEHLACARLALWLVCLEWSEGGGVRDKKERFWVECMAGRMRNVPILHMWLS